MVALRWLPMAEKHRERPLNRQHDIVVEAADGRAKLQRRTVCGRSTAICDGTRKPFS